MKRPLSWENISIWDKARFHSTEHSLSPPALHGILTMTSAIFNSHQLWKENTAMLQYLWGVCYTPARGVWPHDGHCKGLAKMTCHEEDRKKRKARKTERKRKKSHGHSHTNTPPRSSGSPVTRHIWERTVGKGGGGEMVKGGGEEWWVVLVLDWLLDLEEQSPNPAPLGLHPSDSSCHSHTSPRATHPPRGRLIKSALTVSGVSLTAGPLSPAAPGSMQRADQMTHQRHWHYTAKPSKVQDNKGVVLYRKVVKGTSLICSTK